MLKQQFRGMERMFAGSQYIGIEVLYSWMSWGNDCLVDVALLEVFIVDNMEGKKWNPIGFFTA